MAKLLACTITMKSLKCKEREPISCLEVGTRFGVIQIDQTSADVKYCTARTGSDYG